MLNPEDPLVRWATFGRQVEMFLDSPIGQHLLTKARAQSLEATEKLKVADAEDPKIIRALQQQAQIADSILGWLGDVIHEGQGALEALKEDHDGN